MKNIKTELMKLQKWQIPSILIYPLMFFSLFTVVSFVSKDTKNLNILNSDIRGYYTGAIMIKNGIKSNFYDLSTQYYWQRTFAPQLKDKIRLMPFVYPAYLGAGLYPLSFFPLKTAYQIFSFFNVLLIIFIYHFLKKSLDFKNGEKKIIKIYLFLMLITFLPVWETLLQGQLSFILMLSFLGAWHSLKSGKKTQAGFWLSLLFVRPHLLIFPILVMVFKKQFKVLAGAVIGAGAFLTISVYKVGIEGMLQYGRLLLSIPSFGNAYAIHPKQEPTWKGFLHFLNNTDKASDINLLFIIGVIIAGILLIQTLKGKWDPRSQYFNLQWSNIIIVTLFTSPHTNYHDLSLLFIPEVFLATYFLKQYKIFEGQNMKKFIGGVAGISFFISILTYYLFWLYRPMTAPFMGIAIIFLAYLCEKINTENVTAKTSLQNSS